MKIKNLRYGVFYRPIDTPMGKQGWCGDIFWEKFTPRRNNKNSSRDNRHAIAANWTPQELHFGPCETESELRKIYQPEVDRLKQIEANPIYEK